MPLLRVSGIPAPCLPCAAGQAHRARRGSICLRPLGVSDISSDEKLLDALYSDTDTTSDNIGDMMRGAQYQVPVTMAVANLYLRKQIILERV